MFCWARDVVVVEERVVEDAVVRMWWVCDGESVVVVGIQGQVSNPEYPYSSPAYPAREYNIPDTKVRGK